MRKEKIIDETGVPLTPSWQGHRCWGNGEYPGYQCCCDECDYYLKCFPQFKPRFLSIKVRRWRRMKEKMRKNNIEKNKK